MSPTAVDVFCDQQPTRHESSYVYIDTFSAGVSLLLVCGCETIYRLSCDRTLAVDNSDRLAVHRENLEQNGNLKIGKVAETVFFCRDYTLVRMQQNVQ